MKRTLAALVICALACSAGSATAAGGAAAPQIVDLTVRPSGADLARLPGKDDAYAAVYDDRLALSELRYAERRDGRWTTRVLASTIDNRPVGREPTLAISKHGMRLVVFRTEINLDPDHAANSELYAMRSPNGKDWIEDRIDDNGFGASPAFDAQGRPAIAYLVRTSTTDAVDVRLAHFYDGTWHVTTLAHTTYRQAASEANASSVGLALDRYLALKVAYIDPASRSVRLVGEDGIPQRLGTVPATAARASLAFGPNGEVAVVCAGLAGEDARLWVATGRLGGLNHTYPEIGQSVSSAVIAGFVRGAPIVAFRDRRGAFVAVRGTRRYHSTLIQRAARYSASSPFNGAFGAARSGTDSMGIAMVANGALLVFNEGAF
ncbi:MAG TPA: hypothetical protein VGK92_05580 [Gaiellales bacterium]|nr:hypothetical protein [Solirubrobacteraceae bacterium]